MKELFLSSLFAGHELNVVHQQHIDRAIFIAKCGVLLKRIALISSFMKRSDVMYATRSLWSARLDRVADGVHQVRLAEADPAINEKRVVGRARRFGRCLSGGMGELVAGTDDKLLKCIFRIKSVFDWFNIYEMSGGITGA